MNIKTIPKNFITRFITPLILQKKYGRVLEKNKKLKNAKKGKRCFIIGNGPSISQQDLTKLKNEETFVVNTFWQFKDYEKIQPKYYVVVDTDFFPKKNEEGNAWVDDLVTRDSRVSQFHTTLFFNIIGKNFIEKNGLFKNNPIYYLSLHGFFKENLYFNIEIEKIIPNVKNVIIACIIVAAYIGFEKIYLLGCDHDYLAHINYNEGFQHSYEYRKYNVKDPNEVKTYALSTASYERLIDHIKILFKNYRLLYKKIQEKNPQIKIYNATSKSFLDVFPRIDYKDIAFPKNNKYE